MSKVRRWAGRLSGRRVRRAQRLAVEQVDGAERPRRVEHLGERDAHPGLPQGVEEPDLPFDQPPVVTAQFSFERVAARRGRSRA